MRYGNERNVLEMNNKDPTVPPDDCITMKLYGDGKKFNEPVWYSCGKCKKCPRDKDSKYLDVTESTEIKREIK